jgi:MFS family permease
MEKTSIKKDQEIVESLKDEETTKNLSLSIRDGFFASIFATLTGGVFLTGFALAIGANAFHVGIIAAIPLLGNLFQFLGAYLVSKKGKRKPVSIKSATIARFIWILMILLPFIFNWFRTQQIIIGFLVIFVIGNLFSAISGVAWLSWISDLVPETHRGRFFGRRNMIIGIAVLSFTMLGGKFIDVFGDPIWAFQILFFAAVIAGAISIKYLQRIPEPLSPIPARREHYFQTIFRPIKNHNFRMLLLFTMLWSFSVNFAAPFFIVYKLKTLQLSYTYVASLISLASLFDLLGMRFWGHFSDKVGNRPVMLFCSFFATFLPFGWLWTSSNSFSIYFLLPMLQIIAGFFWAGMNLGSVNMLFSLAPSENKPVYFSTYASVNGVFAAIASLIGGIVGLAMAEQGLNLIILHIVGLKIIFLISWVLRCLSLPLLWRVHEPQGLPFTKAIRILRSVRSINSTQGFNPLLHSFTHIIRNRKTTDKKVISSSN